MVRPVLVLMLVARVAAADAPAGEEPTDARAKEHLYRGIERYDAGDYEVAIAEYKAGYAIEPKRLFLAAMAQAERKWGKCDEGDAHFEQWLATDPPADLRSRLEERLPPCVRPVVTPPDRKEPTVVIEATPWYRDRIGGVLAGTGVAALGVGITFGVLSNKATRDASGASTIDGYEDLVDKGKSRKTIAVIGIGVGSALVVGGVLRYVMVMRSDNERIAGRTRPELIGWLDGTSAGIVVAGRL